MNDELIERIRDLGERFFWIALGAVALDALIYSHIEEGFRDTLASVLLVLILLIIGFNVFVHYVLLKGRSEK